MVCACGQAKDGRPIGPAVGGGGLRPEICTLKLIAYAATSRLSWAVPVMVRSVLIWPEIGERTLMVGRVVSNIRRMMLVAALPSPSVATTGMALVPTSRVTLQVHGDKSAAATGRYVAIYADRRNPAVAQAGIRGRATQSDWAGGDKLIVSMTANDHTWKG